MWPDEDPSGDAIGTKTLSQGIKAFKRIRPTMEEFGDPTIHLTRHTATDEDLWREVLLNIPASLSLPKANHTIVSNNEEVERLKTELDKLKHHHIKVRDAANQFYQAQVKKAMQDRRRRFDVEQAMLVPDEALENIDAINGSDTEMDIND